MMDEVCVIGDINLDLIVRIDSPPGIDEDREIRSLQIEAGGTACNTALEIERWGCRVHLFGSIGGDPMGELIRTKLRDHAFEKTLILSNLLTGLCVVLEDPSGRRLITYRGANESTISNLECGRYDLSNCRWIHLSSLEPVALKYVKNFAKRAVVSYDPGGIQVKHLHNSTLIDGLDFLFLNIGEYRLLQFEPAGMVKAVVIKKGKEGAELLIGERRSEVKARKVKRTSRTRGAGDVFDGAFISCMLENDNPEECLRIAVGRASDYVEGGAES